MDDKGFVSMGGPYTLAVNEEEIRAIVRNEIVKASAQLPQPGLYFWDMDDDGLATMAVVRYLVQTEIKNETRLLQAQIEGIRSLLKPRWRHWLRRFLTDIVRRI